MGHNALHSKLRFIDDWLRIIGRYIAIRNIRPTTSNRVIQTQLSGSSDSVRPADIQTALSACHQNLRCSVR